MLSVSPSDAPVELPIAVSSKQVRDVLKSRLSTSVPVANPAIAVASDDRIVHNKEEANDSIQSQEGLPKTGM